MAVFRDSMEMITEAAVEKWMDSESHKKQMLDDRWTETGQVSVSGRYIYISQIFVEACSKIFAGEKNEDNEDTGRA